MSRQESTKRAKSARLLKPDESRKKLEMLVARQFDPNFLDGVVLDKREVGKFVAETIRPLRVAAIAGGLSELTWLLENTFYEAYTVAQSRKQVTLDPSNATQEVH